MRANRATSTIAFGDWLGLYVTGFVLIVFLLGHLLAVHYAASSGSGLTFDAIRQKLQNPVFVVLDLGLLALALYHGLVGLRRVVVDLEMLGARATLVFTWVLVAVGLVGLYYGWLIHRAFVG